MFEGTKFDVDCECGGTVKVTAGDIANERTVRCSRGCQVQLRDGGGARETQKGLRDLDRAIDRLNQKF